MKGRTTDVVGKPSFRIAMHWFMVTSTCRDAAGGKGSGEWLYEAAGQIL